MTNEVAIEIIKAYRDKLTNSASNQLDGDIEAFEMAIQALSQEPITTTNNNEPMTIIYPTIVCDDAISRRAVLDGIAEWIVDGYADSEADCSHISSLVTHLPSVTQKSGKWDRLYSWLNDMRLGIAPDETVDDIDERHCRESQTDILDEIMEWMIKAESEK